MAAKLGYCTNVHAGVQLEELESNLAKYALDVQSQFCGTEPMGLGLWLSATAAQALRDRARLSHLADWLAEHHLIPFTLNGFPYGDFHQDVVKLDVYQPDWSDPRRLSYTRDLIHALDGLLPPGIEGSISTLPIAWGDPVIDGSQLQRAAANLCQITDYLASLESDTGRLIYLCLEPEPGCVLQRGDDVIRFFNEYLLPAGEEQLVRRHIRVCHDICHSAVMFEDQAAAVDCFATAGIRIGKVQVSSAVQVDFAQLSAGQGKKAAAELESFVEDRYLHQTSVWFPGDSAPRFFNDLPDALRSVRRNGPLTGRWRVHFHVPIYLQLLDHVGATRADIEQAFRALARQKAVSHFEVETYAWSVLPRRLHQPTLARGIALEMQWAAEELRRVGVLT